MKTEKLGSPSLKKAAGLSLGGTALYMAGIIGRLRDMLPEPYDIPDHFGNVLCGGVAIGLIAATLGSAAAERAVNKYSLSDLREKPTHFRAAVAGGSIALGAIANGIAEMKLGTAMGTPNQIDYIYGVVASGVFGAIAPGPYDKAYIENLPAPEQGS